jgi:hypothetical protein
LKGAAGILRSGMSGEQERRDESRTDEPRLGPPVERGLPVVPQRWRLPLLLLVVASCVTIFLVSIVYATAR